MPNSAVTQDGRRRGGGVVNDDPRGRQLSRRELLALGAGVLLAVAPGLPFVQSDGALFARFHDWGIFVGGLLIGAVLARAHAELAR